MQPHPPAATTTSHHTSLPFLPNHPRPENYNVPSLSFKFLNLEFLNKWNLMKSPTLQEFSISWKTRKLACFQGGWALVLGMVGQRKLARDKFQHLQSLALIPRQAQHSSSVCPSPEGKTLLNAKIPPRSEAVLEALSMSAPFSGGWGLLLDVGLFICSISKQTSVSRCCPRASLKAKEDKLKLIYLQQTRLSAAS